VRGEHVERLPQRAEGLLVVRENDDVLDSEEGEDAVAWLGGREGARGGRGKAVLGLDLQALGAVVGDPVGAGLLSYAPPAAEERVSFGCLSQSKEGRREKEGKTHHLTIPYAERNWLLMNARWVRT
jgi:hypothetical protein